MSNRENSVRKRSIACNETQHVAGVAPVAPAWPPTWLSAPDRSAEPPRNDKISSADAALSTAARPITRGWRLPSGAVLCSMCHVRPADAEEVELVEQPGGLEWVKATYNSAVIDSNRGAGGPEATPATSYAPPHDASSSSSNEPLSPHPTKDPTWF